MRFGSHFTFGVTRRLLLSSRVSLLVIDLLTIRKRVREKKQGMKLIWGPIYFQAVLKYCGRFFHEFHSNNSLRDKMYGGNFFLFKIRIFVLKMVTIWFLTFDYLNLRLTSESFLSFLLGSEIVSSSIAYTSRYCLVVFVLTEWSSCNVTSRGIVCKLVQSTGGIDCTRAAIEFRPLSLFITINSNS